MAWGWAWAGKTYVAYRDRPTVFLPDYVASVGDCMQPRRDVWGETCDVHFLSRSVTGGCEGTLQVGEHYVQWAKYSGHLQIECVSNTFVDEDDRLGFVQRRLLAELGFSSPHGDVPNYFRLFTEETELPAAADLLVRVVEEVLDETALERLVPRPGNVCFVVPVFKCMPWALDAVLQPTIDACSVRRPTTTIDARGTDEGMLLSDWLEEATDEAPERLVHSFPEEAAGRLRGAAQLATACDRLRRRGVHVFIIGPHFVPHKTRLYTAVVIELVDAVFAVGDHHCVRFCERELTDLFASWTQHKILALYGEEEAAVVGATGMIRFQGEYDEVVQYDVEMARAAALWELDVDR